MADISKITVINGDTYDIKDAEARLEITERVVKTGDTMTGDLTVVDLYGRHIYGNLLHGEATASNLANVLSKETPIIAQGNKQMINPNDLTLDYYINVSGVPTKGNGDCYSGLMPVTPGDQVYYYGIAGKTGNRRFHAYDANGNWIRQITTIQITRVGQAYSSNALTIAEGVAFVRLSFTQYDTEVMVELAPKTSYVPYAGDETLGAFKNTLGMVTVYGGESNEISDKPTGVDSFGAISLPTSETDYGQLLISSNTNKGVYWRTAANFDGGWIKLVDSTDLSNYVSKSGDTVSGVLVANNYVTKYGLEFQNSSGTNVGGIFQDMSGANQVYIDEYTSGNARECYLLPAPTASTASFYDILTTKNAVTPTQGGTGITQYSVGDILHCSSANTLSKLSGNTTSTAMFLKSVGSSGAATAPTWSTLSAGDIPNLSWNKITSDKPTTVSGYGITDAVSTSDLNAYLPLDGNSRTITHSRSEVADCLTVSGASGTTGSIKMYYDLGNIVASGTFTGYYYVCTAEMPGYIFAASQSATWDGQMYFDTTNKKIIFRQNNGNYSAFYSFPATTANVDATIATTANTMPLTPSVIELKPGSAAAGHGGAIDFHFNNSSADYTSRIIEDASGRLSISGKLAVGGNLVFTKANFSLSGTTLTITEPS